MHQVKSIQHKLQIKMVILQLMLLMDLNRILQIVETSASKIITRTTNYIYGVLSNGTENRFNIPTTIRNSNFTITNEVNEKGQVVNKANHRIRHRVRRG